MLPKNKLIYLIIVSVFIISLVNVNYYYGSEEDKNNSKKIHIKFFYEEGCEYCKEGKEYMYNLIKEKSYNVEVQEINVYSSEGWNQFKDAGFTYVPAIILCDKIKLENKAVIVQYLDSMIISCIESSSTDLIPTEEIPEQESKDDMPKEEIVKSGSSISPIAALAAGFFSSLSPCLLAVLSFIIAYTAGGGNKSMTILLKSIFFGLGITGSYMVMAVAFLKAGATMPDNLRFFLALVGAWVTFFLGLNLINTGLHIVNLPISKKNFAQKMTNKLVMSYGLIGVFILGMIFAVINLPCAAIILPILIDEAIYGTTYTATLKVLLYGVGILIPFIIIGGVGAFAKNIARDMRWNPAVRFFGWVVMGGVVVAVSFYLVYQGFSLLQELSIKYVWYTIIGYGAIVLFSVFAFIKWRNKKVEESK
ncbi:MAG: thiol:disulfide interchange protein precursor [Candidatus Methanofastidiosum methylothiophilum]|uniref:Thiol:disulfide interchange protein n=1 Tax=Candidatus Methanofastidiosum methylothiophilum TaxID=1705564 RepID=A0A150IV79_9EURY|nr:MAG: thiol:disulfide interchange protein precursor [Candidatus Methanofastidiosum methylthiophilus]NMC77505.1 cytochrome c biogenesis protein CcdA [Candidatus Methanofastidiosa archaeon]